VRKLNVLCLSFSFNNLLYFNVDDLDRAHAALELYFKTIELVELGKRPPRDNSDIASEVDTGIVTGRGCRERKARKVYDPTTSPTHKNKKTSGCDLSKTTPAEAVKRTCDKTFENGAGQVDEQTKKDFHTESIPVPTPPANLNIMAAKTKGKNVRITNTKVSTTEKHCVGNGALYN